MENKGLPKKEGMYNPALRFAFTNILDEEFVSAWDSQPIRVKAHQTIEVNHNLADKFTNELIDKIMIGELKEKENQYYRTNPGASVNSYRAPNSLGIPAVRKTWEEKIIRRLEVDEESPEIQIMRAQIRAEVKADMERSGSNVPIVPETKSGTDDFAEVKAKNAKKPLKAKTIKNETSNSAGQ